MRTEIALAALGFVSVISVSSLLSSYVQIDSKRILLDTVRGSVGWGNFSYWKLSPPGALLLELTSVRGDADLYVSDTERPSYEADRNNFSSATCGLDTVWVPHTFPRPIGIGVFGHWSHEVTDYTMNVYLDTAADEPDAPATQWEPLAREQQPREARAREPRAREAQQPARRTSDSPLLLALLSVLDMLGEMLIM